MDDEEMDLELRSLFSDDELTVDPEAPAATELLDAIVSSGSEKAPVAKSLGERGSVAAPVLELTDSLPHTADRRAGRGLLVAAAIAVVTLLGVGAWAATDTDSTLASNGDEPDEDSPAHGSQAHEDGSSLAIQGLEVPLVVLLESEVESTEGDLIRCLSLLGGFSNTPSKSLGPPAFVNTSVFDAQDGFDQVVFAEVSDTVVSCEGRSGSGSGSTREPSDSEPVVVSSWGGGGGEWSFKGRAIDSVDEIVVINPPFDDQVFRRNGDAFRVDARGQSGDPSTFLDDWEAEVRLDDGTIQIVTSDEPRSGSQGVERCRTDVGCVTDRVTALADEALAADARPQYEALVDGVLDQMEYDAAIGRLRMCLEGTGSVRLDAPTSFITATSPGYAAVQGCNNETIRYVEAARGEQNSHAQFVDMFDSSDTSGGVTSTSESSGSPTTAAPTTTTSIATTASTVLPLQSNIAARTPAGINRAAGRGVGIVDGTGDVVEIDLDTGQLVGTLAMLDAEATYYGAPQLNWDGSAIYVSEDVEDRWFSCESSPGAIRRVDLTTGETKIIATGTDPKVSPDGTKLAYLAASQCIPDVYSSNPDDFVLTIYDSVVIRDLSTGDERTWVDEDLAALIKAEGEGQEPSDLGEGQLSGLAWVSADVVAVGNVRLDARTLRVIRTAAGNTVETGTVGETLGYNDEVVGFVVAVSINPGRVTLSVGRENGTWERLYPAAFTTVAFDGTLDNLALLDGRTLYVDGRTVELDVDLVGFDW